MGGLALGGELRRKAPSHSLVKAVRAKVDVTRPDRLTKFADPNPIKSLWIFPCNKHSTTNLAGQIDRSFPAVGKTQPEAVAWKRLNVRDFHV